MDETHTRSAPGILSISGSEIAPSVVINGVGRFTPEPNGKWVYVPDPNLTPDEAAINLIAAINRLSGHSFPTPKGDRQ